MNNFFELTEEIVIEYAGEPTKRVGNENQHQCSECVKEGGDTSGDNLHYNVAKGKLLCRANKEHSKIIYNKIKAKYAPKSNFISTKDIEMSEEKLKEYNQYLMQNPEKLELLLQNARWTNKTIQENQIGYAEKENLFILPMRTMDGELVGYEFRDGDRFKHICKTKGYADDKKKTLCLINTPEKAKHLVICAGFKDAITMYQYLKEKGTLDDYQIVTCSNGEGNTLTALEENKDLLEKYEMTILCLDRDIAGRAAMDKIAEGLHILVYELTMPYIKNPEKKSFKDFTDWYKLTKEHSYDENIFDKNLKLSTYSLFNHYIKNPGEMDLNESCSSIIAPEHEKVIGFIKSGLYKYKNCYFKIKIRSDKEEQQSLSAEKKSNFIINVTRKIINHREKHNHQTEYKIELITCVKNKTTPPLILTQKELFDNKNIHDFFKTNEIHISSLSEVELKNVILKELNDNPKELHSFENPGLAHLDDKKYWLYANACLDIETKDLIKEETGENGNKSIPINGNKEIRLDVVKGMFEPTIYIPNSGSVSDFLKEKNNPYLQKIYDLNKNYNFNVPTLIAHTLIVNTMEAYNYMSEPFLLLGAAVMSPFVDLIVESMKGFPVSFAFGEPQSGKSNLLELISSIFGFDSKFLNGGNDTYLNLLHGLEYYNRIPVLYSEVEGGIRNKFEETVKSVYDRNSRKRQTSYNKSQDVTAVNATLFFGSNTIAHRNSQTSTRLLYTEFKKDNFDYRIAREFNNIRPYASLILKEILGINPMMIMGYIQGAHFDLEMMKTNIDQRSINNIAIARAGMRLLFNVAGIDAILSLDGHKKLEENFISYINSYSESIEIKDLFDIFIEVFIMLVRDNKVIENVDFKLMDNNRYLAINIKGIYSNFSKYFKQSYESNIAIPSEKEIKIAVKAKGHDSNRNVKYGSFQCKSLSIDLESDESLSHIKPTIIDAICRKIGVPENAKNVF